MKSVMRPGFVRVDLRHKPSTVRRRGARLDKNDEAQTPGRKGPDLVGLHRPQMKQLDFGGTGSPAASMRAVQRARSQPHSRKG